MSFETIVGHKENIWILKESFKNKRVAPVYLFTGPGSIGKRKVAVNFAKLLNCLEQGQTVCDSCLSCRKIDTLNLPDVFHIGPGGKGKVINIEQIRDLKKNAGLRPFESRVKVFIIDTAELLTQEASNAVLKIFEESSPSTVFILITSQPHRILSTIMSRSRVMRFRVSPVKVVRKEFIERYGMSRKEADLIAKFSEGRMGIALGMKESGISVKKNMAIDKVLGVLTGRDSGIDNSQWRYDSRSSLKEDISYFLLLFRDILLSGVTGEERLIVNTDRLDEIRRLSQRFSFARVEKLINKLIFLDSYVDANVNMKIIVDSFLCELAVI